MAVHCRLIIVDDDVLALHGLMPLLSRAVPWAVVESFTNPAQALERIRHAACDVILSDFNMPDMNGIGLLRATREQGSDASFLLMTGDHRDDILTEGLRLGLFALLHKPIEPVILIPLVLQAIDCHRLRQEVAELRRQLSDSGHGSGAWMADICVAADVDTQPLLPF